MQPTVINPVDVFRTLLRHPIRWLVPAVLVASLVGAYAVVRPDTWQATQTFMLRNEAVNNPVALGRFGHTDEMRALQETILQIAHSRSVLEGTLREVGPPAGYQGDPAHWPSRHDLADLRDAIEFSPPDGAEFGTTEVFYLNVRATDRQRAIALNEAIQGQLEKRFKQVRDSRAQGMINELEGATEVARADLAKANERLSAIERKVGGDLAELRALEDSTSDDSTLRQSEMQIRAELREVRAQHRVNEELLGLLERATADPGELIAAPNSLLASQPGLSRLKEGLVDAQINTATLMGRMSAEHPMVKAAEDAEQEIGRHLYDELAIAIRGIESEQRSLGRRERMLDDQLADIDRRLVRLAELRATYASEVAAADHRTELLRQSEDDLANARAALVSARAANLLTRIDDADTGVNPVGPGRSTIALAGIMGGLIVGFGVVFLTVDFVPEKQTIDVTTAKPGPVNGSANGHKTSGDVLLGEEHFARLSIRDALRKVSRTPAMH